MICPWRRLRCSWEARPPRPAGDPNPFEAYLLGAAVVQGAVVLIGWARPTSIELALPLLLRILWAGLLLTGGAVALLGLYWPNPLTGIEIKRPGLVAVGTATLTYGIALVPLGPAGLVAATANVAFALACGVRVWQVTRRVNEVRAHLVASRRRA